MIDPDLVRYKVDRGVATVSLNRPERLNAIDLATGRAYNAALRRADADPEVRVIIITGAGRAFCSGADLSAMEPAPTTTALERLPADGLQPELALFLRKPVIAAVHGPAIGVGLVLALFADIRFIAAEAPLALSFTRLGLVAEYGTAWLLPRLVGATTAAHLLLSGARFDGAEAGRMGLTHQVLPAADVFAAALEYALDIAHNCSPAALAAAKAQILSGFGPGLMQALAESRNRMLATLDSADVVEGFSAAAQRRSPNFAALPGDGRDV
jgi:enoyl-CoA hydratase/carnithine racemase